MVDYCTPRNLPKNAHNSNFQLILQFQRQSNLKAVLCQMKEFLTEIKYYRSPVLSSLLLTHVKQLFPLRSIQQSKTFGVPLKLYVLQSPVHTRREVSSSLSIPHFVILKSFKYKRINLNKKNYSQIWFLRLDG